MGLAVYNNVRINHSRTIKSLEEVNRKVSIKESHGTNSSMTSSMKSLSNSMNPSLKDGADPKFVSKVPLIPINSSFGIVTSNDHDQLSMRDMVRRQCKKNKSDLVLVFAVRRPGCGACREHGLQLTELANNDKNITCVGIVKETGSQVVHAGLLEFYQYYFKFPLYKDEKWNVYKAMGNRAVSKMTAIINVRKLLQRFKRSGVLTKMSGGDHFTQGGILIFDRKGTLQYTYYEEYAELLDMNIIQKVIDNIRQEKLNSSGDSTSTESMSESMSIDNRSH